MGTSKGRKAVILERVKQVFGKQKFAGPSLTMGHREDVEHKSPARFLPVYHAGVPMTLRLSMMTAPSRSRPSISVLLGR